MKIPFATTLLLLAFVNLVYARLETRVIRSHNFIKRAMPEDNCKDDAGSALILTENGGRKTKDNSTGIGGGGGRGNRGGSTPPPINNDQQSKKEATPGGSGSGAKKPSQKPTNKAGGDGLVSANTKRPDFILGVAVHSEYLDGSLDDCILPHANLITPEYEMKWDPIEREQGKFNWDPIDKMVKYAKAHSLLIRGHVLLWEQSLPEWVNRLKGDPAAMKEAIESHITAVLERYGDDMVHVDVINELFDFSGNGQLKNTPFFEALGEDYITIALNAARAANSKVKLYVNENDVEGFNSKGIPGKRQGLTKLIKKLVAQKAPLDGIGFESHFTSGQVPQDLGDSMKEFIDLGLEVMITELDIIDSGDKAQLAKDWAFVYSTCVNMPGCVGVDRWDMSDDKSWQPGKGSELFGPNCSSKGLEDGVKAALSGK